ncbi:hydroxyisourate hydrolase [Corynebacterium terpenotabidum]|uniref:5-hydroxyisourate hydrolase n=1 Tax=Corynebacterium terpenotabidum Y-11 TaxID=1200352 RepID=S4XJD7_9CORY|nr:hydroxyisourate hydrolase [Corynebacterium terpenotabidum]AGP31865.1 hypothetical protein A606_11130 [Corynebacterium terpenotabidum Y-11]
MSLSTHCLNTTTGLPAEGLLVELVSLAVDGAGAEISAVPTVLESATTDADGRHRFALSPEPGTYRLRFHTGAFLAAQDTDTLYPWVDITFTVEDPAVNPAAPTHLHIPLLLNPFGYSTYRGS